MNILCCSGGNDSVALIRWAYLNRLKDVTVLYNDTGWAAPFWGKRMEDLRALCIEYGFSYAETKSVGFCEMVKLKKGFPMAAGPMQFCSDFLKKQPTLKWLKDNDPGKKAIIYIGIRREESRNRKDHPSEILGDSKYEGRLQKFPLTDYTEKERDFLIDETGLDILLHSSMECFPCVNANRADLRLLARYPSRINQLRKLEQDMGFTKKGKPKVMFRPYRHMGATGISEVIAWAIADKGKYKKTL